MENNKVQFLPFQAINAFMRPDYRFEVIKSLLGSLATIPGEKQAQLNRLIKNVVVIPGFRHSLLAPLSVKTKPFIAAFEKKPELVALTIDIWALQHKDLQEKTYQLLTDRGWEVLPIETDRTKLPGFLTSWPQNEDFDSINKAFVEKYPEGGYSSDNISLMAVWLSGRLPYQVPETNENA